MKDKLRSLYSYSFCLIVLGSLVVSPFAGAQEKPKPAPPKQGDLKRSAEEESVKETLLRYLFAKQKVDPESRVYFLANGQRDVNADFLLRFKNNPIPVKNVSQASYSAVSVPFDKTTHQRGCAFDLSQFRWVNDNKALVRVHVHWGGKEGYGGIYPLVREGNKWVVQQPTGSFRN